MSIKNPLTPAGIEPATFRFGAQHLNHCATAVPRLVILRELILNQGSNRIRNSSGGPKFSFCVLPSATMQGICCISFNGFLEQHNFIHAVSKEFCYPMPEEAHDFQINTVTSTPFCYKAKNRCIFLYRFSLLLVFAKFALLMQEISRIFSIITSPPFSSTHFTFSFAQ